MMTVSPTILLSLVIVLALVHGAFSGGVDTYHCLPGYVPSSVDETMCLRPIRRARHTWNGAVAACKKRGGTLATLVQYPADIKEVTRRLNFQGHFWIGVKAGAGDTWEDLNGVIVSSPPFKRGRGNRHGCVTVKKGSRYWFDKNCNKKRFYVCQFDAEVTTV